MWACPFPKFLAMSREVRKYHLLRRFVSGICILFLFPALGRAAVPGGHRDTLSVAEKKDSIVEAMITADRHAEQARSQTGHKRLEKGDFIYGNVVFSSPDLIKAIQNLPGVNAGTELMSGLYVHGGEGSDNLFLLDSVPMYQGPLVRGKTSFNIAFRRSWMDAVLAPVISMVNKGNTKGETIGGTYSFYDLNASVTHRFSRDNILSKVRDNPLKDCNDNTELCTRFTEK